MEERYGIALRLIVIDTMLAAFDIRDWNDPAEARRVANILSRIAVETGSVVLGIQHRGKDVSWGAAGSYALTAAADFVLSVFADTDSEGGISARRIAVTRGSTSVPVTVNPAEPSGTSFRSSLRLPENVPVTT